MKTLKIVCCCCSEYSLLCNNMYDNDNLTNSAVSTLKSAFIANCFNCAYYLTAHYFFFKPSGVLQVHI